MDDGERSDASKSGTQTDLSCMVLRMADTPQRTNALVGRLLEDLTSRVDVSRDGSASGPTTSNCLLLKGYPKEEKQTPDVPLKACGQDSIHCMSRTPPSI